MQDSPISPLFERLVIIGPGLIGSSLLRRACLDRTIARTLVTTDHNPQVCAHVTQLGIADEVHTELAAAVEGADGVILCIPVGAMGEVTEQIIPLLSPGTLLSEVGSTKVSVIRAVSPFLRPDIFFIPTHPMAGTEFSGPDAGFSTLFENRWCLITPNIETVTTETQKERTLSPLPQERENATRKIETLWQKTGAKTRRMDPIHHDKVCAMVSHLPHLLAFTICSTADDLADETRSEVLDYAASGFRDFTRIASSDPIMWRDIFLNNKEALLEMLARFMEDAQAMARAIRWEDSEFIMDRIERGRRIRHSLIDNKQA
ncbi:prephenate dehydrogenase/arogenate dehydrogenase family protein [Entomobacter blattae]|uniref:Cyclohexadienyl dehydrogenase n=1 Tax=Entomobacter blattae TaxID=2762277 RepID=A0A7H1NPF5_9PROT|nr:prephenate dehydrogenase/arogenate dehydrogenase family protein [Entomobacter blattae]QNT77665.1 Cyclohexadienyl dehydrogenase [Entomobacter blattae]